MKMSSLRGSMARRLQARLVLPLSLSLAGGLAPAQGQSPGETPPVVLTQDSGVSFQKGAGASTGGTLSLGTNAGSVSGVIATISSGATLSLRGDIGNIGSSTLSGATLQVGNSQRISGSTSAVNFNGAILVGEPFTGGTLQLTPNPTSLIQPSGLSLTAGSINNLAPLGTGTALVKTGAGTLRLSGSSGTVTTLNRHTIYMLDPLVAPASLLSGGTIRLFNPASGVISGGTLSLTGGTTRPLVTLGGTFSPGVSPGTSIYAGEIFDLATGTSILPTTGAVLRVNGTGSQTFAGSNTLSVAGGTLSAGTLLLRTNSVSMFMLNDPAELSGTTPLSDGQTLSPITAVPEPGSAVLLLGGALGLAARRRRRPHPERA